MNLESLSDYIWVAAFLISVIAFVAILIRLGNLIYSDDSSREVAKFSVLLLFALYGIIESISYFVGIG